MIYYDKRRFGVGGMQSGPSRSALILCHDMSVAGACLRLAFLLRTGAELNEITTGALELGTPVFVLLARAAFYLFAEQSAFSWRPAPPRPVSGGAAGQWMSHAPQWNSPSVTRPAANEVPGTGQSVAPTAIYLGTPS